MRVTLIKRSLRLRCTAFKKCEYKDMCRHSESHVHDKDCDYKCLMGDMQKYNPKCKQFHKRKISRQYIESAIQAVSSAARERKTLTTKSK